MCPYSIFSSLLQQIMAESALQVIKYCYHALIDSLPLEDSNFLAVLDEHNLLGDIKSLLESMPTREKRAAHFLDTSILQQLENNNVTSFEKLIAVMSDSTSNNLKALAAQITAAIKIKDEVIADASKLLYCHN